MKALLLEAHGGNEKLAVGERAMPSPGPRDVVVKVLAAALNRLDLFVRNGMPGVKVPFPHVPGSDACGTVLAVGAEVTDLVPGARVVVQPGISCLRCEFCLRGEKSVCLRYEILGEQIPGTFCEAVAVPRENVYPAPAGLTDEECAAFPLAGLTAWRMLVTRARLLPGETVLIHGIGGGVSTFALQIAKLAGASLVIVTSRSAGKLTRAKELGADVTLDSTRTDVGREVRALTGKRGVDVVVDSVGAATWRASLQAAAKLGRIVTCGASSGPNPEEELRTIFWKQLTILGSTMGTDAEFAALLPAISAGRIRPVVDTVFPLGEARAAYDRLETNPGIGKIVLRVG
ncbi:MAG: zinc-binding dehydrogenase [Acidobacteria bacterium]|nr:zinc-binding dehydrogenase [Acidobacteriota bacterium]